MSEDVPSPHSGMSFLSVSTSLSWVVRDVSRVGVSRQLSLDRIEV